MNDEDFYNNIHNYLKEWEDFKDLALTHKKLKQLQSNWNSLREWVQSEYNRYLNDTENLIYSNVEVIDFSRILDKMNELEKSDNK